MQFKWYIVIIKKGCYFLVATFFTAMHYNINFYFLFGLYFRFYYNDKNMLRPFPKTFNPNFPK